MILDIGNTNVSFIQNGLSNTVSTPHFLENLGSFMNNETLIVFASVVPYASEKLKEHATQHNIRYHEVFSNDIPIQINLKNSKEVGIDRLINAFAGSQKYGSNVIIVDFGTALTFDIVHNQEYEGGMIYAGIEMAMHNLHTRTAKLPDIKIHEFQTGIGKNTIEAMHFGACIGYLGTIKETLNFIQQFYSTQFMIVFTGGSGKMFYKEIPDAVFEQNLILEFLQSLEEKI